MRPDPSGEALLLLPDERLAGLLSAIRKRRYQLVGPTLRDAAITFAEIDSVADLPSGLSDRHQPGRYRVEESASPERFGYASGPGSLKPYLFPPRLPLWQARRDENRLRFIEEHPEPPRYAFIGARPCDLQAVAIQDRVFLESAYADTDYRRRRENALFVAVNCLRPCENCFCSSMGSGPSTRSGYDILLTEQVADDSLYYLAHPGSREGLEILNALDLQPASEELVAKAQGELADARHRITRQLDTERVGSTLKRRLESPRWDDIESRCLACSNCVLVCPTCFCSAVEDATSLAGNCADRSRVWDSCFQQSHSYVAGGSIRSTVKGRYRQWLTHKLSSWPDQFNTLGCVGCGRCITWCPVGIDVVEEANALCAESNTPNTSKKGVSP